MPVRMTKEGRASTREEYRYEQKQKSKKEKFLSGGQAKIAAKAPPPNKIDQKDFAVLRAEKAKGRGMGLQDEKVKPGKVQKAALGMLALGIMGKKYLDKKKSSSNAPMMGAAAEIYKKKKQILGKKMGGVMKYKRGSGLDLPVISSVKPAVHKTKRTQNLSKMKIQFNKQRSRMGDFAKKKGLPKPLNTSANFKGAGKFPYVSMGEMRKAKGFKPGESATDFNKRRKMLAGVTKAASATKIGKIAVGIGALGIGAKKYLESKMNKKKDVKKKMGGGMMMQRPMGYKEGRSISTRGGGVDSSIIGKLRDAGPFKRAPLGKSRLTDKDRKNLRELMQKRSSRKKGTDTARSVLTGLSSMASPGASAISSAYKLAKKMRSEDRTTERDIETAKSAVGMGSKNRPIKKKDSSRNPNPKTPKMMNMGGMMMQRPMGYKHGTSVKAKCKLGRNKPTKIT